MRSKLPLILQVVGILLFLIETFRLTDSNIVQFLIVCGTGERL